MNSKVALVTGAGAGIGRATALELARRGLQVVISDIADDGLAKTAKEADSLSGEVFTVRADISKEAQVRSLIDRTLDRYGQLDIAVNNAGIEGASASTADYTLADWGRVIDVNLTGQWLCMKYELAAMQKGGGGSIINVSSILGKVGFVNAPAYTAAKHGLIGLTEAAALEYGTAGIRINAVCPGFIVTPMLERAGITSDEETRKQITALHPIGRMGTAQEVARAIAWVASEEASFVTGHSLMVDGGYVAR